MHEGTPSGSQEQLIELPSSLRIRQRMGQISTGRAFSEGVTPRLTELGGETISPEALLASVALALSEYAEEHMMGMTALAYTQVPAVIHELVKDSPDKEELTLGLWEQMVLAKKEKDADEIGRIKNRYLAPQHKLPRKLKKANQQRNGNRTNKRSSRRRG